MVTYQNSINSPSYFWLYQPHPLEFARHASANGLSQKTIPSWLHIRRAGGIILFVHKAIPTSTLWGVAEEICFPEFGGLWGQNLRLLQTLDCNVTVMAILLYDASWIRDITKNGSSRWLEANPSFRTISLSEQRWPEWYALAYFWLLKF